MTYFHQLINCDQNAQKINKKINLTPELGGKCCTLRFDTYYITKIQPLVYTSTNKNVSFITQELFEITSYFIE